MTATEPRVVEAPRIRRRAGPQWGRIVLGSLIVAVGVGSMLDAQGVSVPWRFVPAVGLVLVGVVLLLSLAVGVEADVVAGSVTVDGGKVEEGVDLSWSRPATSPAPVVAVDLGVGDVEVHRVGS
ncbi:hypothetical protein ACL02T_23175 [Pseudonocardia sp. RS010]|uniref:hypothetical protein n=1 Tax=Pseudonocardia sp. RS010 TaxID=3385979 RepID=UPI0039A069D7